MSDANRFPRPDRSQISGYIVIACCLMMMQDGSLGATIANLRDMPFGFLILWSGAFGILFAAFSLLRIFIWGTLRIGDMLEAIPLGATDEGIHGADEDSMRRWG